MDGKGGGKSTKKGTPFPKRKEKQNRSITIGRERTKMTSGGGKLVCTWVWGVGFWVGGVGKTGGHKGKEFNPQPKNKKKKGCGETRFSKEKTLGRRENEPSWGSVKGPHHNTH